MGKIKLIDKKDIDKKDIDAIIEHKKNTWDFIFENYTNLMKNKLEIDKGFKQLDLGYLNVSTINKAISIESIERSFYDNSIDVAIPVYLYLLEYKHVAREFLEMYMGKWSGNYAFSYRKDKKLFSADKSLRFKALQVIMQDKNYILKNWDSQYFCNSYKFSEDEKDFLYNKLYDYYASKISTGTKVLTVMIDLFRDRCKQEHIDLYCQRLLNRKDVWRAKQILDRKVIKLTDDQRLKIDSILMFDKMK